MLGSDIQEDLCRNCGGGGEDCNTVTGLLDEKVSCLSSLVTGGQGQKSHGCLWSTGVCGLIF